MQFSKTWEKVLSGEKTATSRIVKPGDIAIAEPALDTFGDEIAGVTYIHEVRRNDRSIYRLGQIVAIQPGRGKKAVGRVRITGIDRYDVRTIAEAQAHAEGFRSKWEFLKVWCSMHDSVFYQDWINMGNDSAEAIIPVVIERRPTDRYDAWLLTFTLLEAQS